MTVDRTTSPPTYRMHGASQWSGHDTCEDPPSPMIIRSDWADEHRGTISGDVMSGGSDDRSAYELSWHFTRAGASFPPPAGCYEPASERWQTVSSDFHAWYGGHRATVTWRRISTTDCVDQFEPESGTARYLPGDNPLATAPCRTYIVTPDSGPVQPDDGWLMIDRSTNPPTFDFGGRTTWAGEETCVRPDGTTEPGDQPGGSWGEAQGAYQTVPFAGGFGSAGDAQMDWVFSRP